MKHMSTRLRTLQGFAIFGAITLLVAACGTTSSNPGTQLASDQTLRMPLNNDIGSFDPAQVSAAVDIDFTQNIFDGLLKLDKDLKVVPDIATALPDVSSDGLTYTFHLKKNVKFSNGDPVTAKDFVYSWNRTAHGGGDYDSLAEPIKGFSDVQGKGKSAPNLAGLSAPDDYTLKAELSSPAAYWVTEVALWGMAVTDRKVIEAKGEDTWWTTPDGLVGTGPFKMSARVPKQSLDFVPVANWWGGSTGALKKVHVEILEDQASQVKKYEQGGYDLVGYLDNFLTPEDALRYQSSAQLKSQLHVIPGARTTWVGFNYTKGPFKGVEDGKLGRQALSEAIDRNQLVDVACAHALQCVTATGGLISRGLKGYLGDNQDPTAKFDAAKAKADLQQWDPSGTKLKGLTYSYNPTALNKATAENLVSQWKANLNIDVKIEVVDRQTFFKSRNKYAYTIFRHSWSADYDHPQDWFDFLFVTGAGSGGTGYSDSKVDDLVKKADALPIDQALPLYKQAAQQMITDVYGAPLYYSVKTEVFKPYLQGVGGNALYDYLWTDAKILQH
jgi:oligopeptide transport system substrate-binding protein